MAFIFVGLRDSNPVANREILPDPPDVNWDALNQLFAYRNQRFDHFFAFPGFNLQFPFML
jgi:hypothetical protein